MTSPEHDLRAVANASARAFRKLGDAIREWNNRLAMEATFHPDLVELDMEEAAWNPEA